MRLISLTFIGLCVLCVTIALSSTHVKTQQMMQAQQIYYQKVLSLSVEDAGETMKQSAQVYGETDVSVRHYNTKQVSEAFFRTLFFNLNANTPEKQGDLSLRIPCIVMLDEDGYTLNVLENVLVNGEIVLTRITLPKKPYALAYKEGVYHLDINLQLTFQRSFDGVSEKQVGNLEDLIKNKSSFPQMALIQDYSSAKVIQQLFIDQLAEDVNFYTKRHQYLARQCGLYYEFNFSNVTNAWQNSLGGIGVFAMIQGVQGYGGQMLAVDSFQRISIEQVDYVFGILDQGIKYYCKMNCVKHLEENATQIFMGAKQAAGEGYFPCTCCFGALKTK